jgi:hypothetical protein
MNSRGVDLAIPSFNECSSNNIGSWSGGGGVQSDRFVNSLDSYEIQSIDPNDVVHSASDGRLKQDVNRSSEWLLQQVFGY